MLRADGFSDKIYQDFREKGQFAEDDYKITRQRAEALGAESDKDIVVILASEIEAYRRKIARLREDYEEDSALIQTLRKENGDLRSKIADLTELKEGVTEAIGYAENGINLSVSSEKQKITNINILFADESDGCQL